MLSLMYVCTVLVTLLSSAATANEQFHHKSLASSSMSRLDLSSKNWPVYRSPRDLTCRLNAGNSNIRGVVKTMATSGSSHLVVYALTLPDPSYNQLIDNFTDGNTTTAYYKPSVAYRIFTSQGQLLLKLPFHRRMTSLGLLQFGVEKLFVNVVDSPPNCFSQLPTSGGFRSETIRNLLVKDLDEKVSKAEQEEMWNNVHGAVCQQIVQSKSDDIARFAFNCCQPVLQFNKLRCELIPNDDIDVIRVLFFVSAVVKILFLLFGPLLLRFLFFSRSTGRTDYIVPLKSDLHKTILVKKIAGDEHKVTSSPSSGQGRPKEMQHFTCFRQLIKSLPSEEIVQVTFNRMDITVNRGDLLSDREPPVGLMRFLYSVLIRCNCRLVRESPVNSCCLQSIVGSWSPRYLWFPLFHHCDCNRGCRECCPWVFVFHAVGWLLLIVGIPLPFIARLILFYVFEKDEIHDRQAAVDELNLEYAIGHDLFQWLTPTHAAMITLYVAYLVSAAMFVLLRVFNRQKLDAIISDCLTDLRRIDYSACGRMILGHLLLPFDKFGVFGVLAAFIFWPLVLPWCILTAICYLVPTIYVVGRLVVPSRPRCLRKLPTPTSDTAGDDLSAGVTSFESCCFLDSISPENRIPTPAASPQHSTDKTLLRDKQQSSGRQRNVIHCCSTFLIGLCLSVLLLSILVMYAEAVGFLVEVIITTVIGAILNAANGAMLPVVMFVICLSYVAICYWRTIDEYVTFSRNLFAALKRHLATDLLAASSLRNGVHCNTAFKYYNNDQCPALKDIHFRMDVPLVQAVGAVQSKRRETVGGRYGDDSIEYRNNKLHWKINSLVLFVDVDETTYVPRELFNQLCVADIPTSPGSNSTAVVRLAGRLLLSAIYLAILTAIVRVVCNKVELTNTMQIIMITICAIAPLIVYVIVVKYQSLCSNTDTFSLAGQVQQIMLTYTQAWPVHDLLFLQIQHSEAPLTERSPGSVEIDGQTLQSRDVDASSCRQQVATSADSTELKSLLYNQPHDVTDPAQVDLLITIRDDSNDRADMLGATPSGHRTAAAGPGIANLRSSERASFGSGGSMFDRPSPVVEEVAPVSGVCTSQPINASRPRSVDRRQEVSVQYSKESDTVGLLLSKQTTVSNEIRTNDNSPAVVVDLMADGDVTATMVKYPETAFNTTSGHSVSTRSLQSFKEASDTNGQTVSDT